MRTLTGDEGIDPSFGNFCNFAACPACDDRDPRDLLRSGRANVHPPAEDLFKPIFELFPAALPMTRQPNPKALDLNVRLRVDKPKRLRQQGVVAPLGMHIEGQMTRINRQSRLHRHAQFAVKRPGHRLRALPKHAVMHNQQARSARCHGFDHRQGRIHRRHHAINPAPIGQLQAIHRARIIGDLRNPQLAIEKIHQFMQICHDTSMPPIRTDVEKISAQKTFHAARNHSPSTRLRVSPSANLVRNSSPGLSSWADLTKRPCASSVMVNPR